MAYGHSPFEVEGSSVTLAVQGGQYRFPQNDKVYTQSLRHLIAFMLVVDKSKRPNIHQVRSLISFSAFLPCFLPDEGGSAMAPSVLHEAWS